MLRNIPPILSPDLLHALRAMGHGDEIVIVDANFPATRLNPNCIRLDGTAATDALSAILTVMPLDSFVTHPAFTMQVVGEPDTVSPICAEFASIIEATADNPTRPGTLERFEFYERAKTAFAIVQTGERRIYGNIILKKGIIAP